VQVRNHRNPIATLEYRASGGPWVTLPRSGYSYFVQTNPGMGLGPYTLRVTDRYGNTLTDNNIPHMGNGAPYVGKSRPGCSWTVPGVLAR
jgi:expansin (peptidoglycan-binding protein)